jgi:ABC-2 type transport system ATP-binding protein
VDKEVLMKIPGVLKIEVVSKCEFLFAGPAEYNLREKIFKFAMDNKLTLLTIQKKEETLEEAFRKLTLHR